MDFCNNYINTSYQFDTSHMKSSMAANMYDTSLGDSGFDSILMRDDNDSMSFMSPIKPALPMCPTPTKHAGDAFQFTMTTTPNKRSIVDLDGIYYSCLRSPSQSPQNYLQNTKAYVHERDTCLINLLRSPVVNNHRHPQPAVSPNRIIKCRSFETSTQDDHNDSMLTTKTTAFTTPTQDEFIELLYRNHLPPNPECLIGRHMGLDHMDLVGELNRRSMYNVIDIILRKLRPNDYANMYRVSKTWKHIIQADKKVNRQRIKFLKYKKEYIEATKENLINDCKEVDGLLKPLKKLKRLSNGAFSNLDLNCLNNSASSLAQDFYQMEIIECSKSSYDQHASMATCNRNRISSSIMQLESVRLSPIKMQNIIKSSTTKTCISKSKKNLKRL